MRITIRDLLGTLFLFAVAAACVRLGFWQLDRLEARRERNAGLAARIEAPPLEITSALGDTTGLRFRRAVASGRYDGPRSIVLPGHSLRGAPGVHLLTPLRLPGRSAVLVNRGWVPSADAATIDPAFFEGEDSVRVTGTVMPFPMASPAGYELPEETGFHRVWFAVDEAALRRQFPYPLLNIVLRRLPGDGGSGYPTALPPPALDEGPHLGYAIQWFSFAVIAVGGWIAMVLHTRAESERRRVAQPGD